jgi:hypothetical protein
MLQFMLSEAWWRLRPTVADSRGATNSGGVLASYRFFFSDSHGGEVNYGYSLNT